MSNEINVGDWTITDEQVVLLSDWHRIAGNNRKWLASVASQCCEILGIDLNADTIARDICEEIVMHGTPVDEVVAKLQRHLEGGR
jgi:hypothetical protein